MGLVGRASSWAVFWLRDVGRVGAWSWVKDWRTARRYQSGVLFGVVRVNERSEWRGTRKQHHASLTPPRCPQTSTHTRHSRGARPGTPHAPVAQWAVAMGQTLRTLHLRAPESKARSKKLPQQGCLTSSARPVFLSLGAAGVSPLFHVLRLLRPSAGNRTSYAPVLLHASALSSRNAGSRSLSWAHPCTPHSATATTATRGGLCSLRCSMVAVDTEGSQGAARGHAGATLDAIDLVRLLREKLYIHADAGRAPQITVSRKLLYSDSPLSPTLRPLRRLARLLVSRGRRR